MAKKQYCKIISGVQLESYGMKIKMKYTQDLCKRCRGTWNCHRQWEVGMKDKEWRLCQDLKDEDWELVMEKWLIAVEVDDFTVISS